MLQIINVLLLLLLLLLLKDSIAIDFVCSKAAEHSRRISAPYDVCNSKRTNEISHSIQNSFK